MAQYVGRLQGPDLEPSTVLIDIADGRFRVSSGRIHLGSWAQEKVTAERTSIYRFKLDINGDEFEFYPEDPSAFSDAVGAFIDLTEPRSRFGLKERIQETLGNS